MASREIGDIALAEMVSILEECEFIELDFHGCDPTPSFADQAVGNLAKQLGVDEFRRRVKIRNLPETARPLMVHVILKAARH